MEPEIRLEEFCRKALLDIGLSAHDARAVVDHAKNLRQANNYRWNYPTERLLTADLENAVQTIKEMAMDWLTDHKPRHPALALLLQKELQAQKELSSPAETVSPAETTPPDETAPRPPLKIRGKLTSTFGDNAECYAVSLPACYNKTEIMEIITQHLNKFRMHAEFVKDARGRAKVNKDGACMFVVEDEMQPNLALRIVHEQYQQLGLTCTLEPRV